MNEQQMLDLAGAIGNILGGQAEGGATGSGGNGAAAPESPLTPDEAMDGGGHPPPPAPGAGAAAVARDPLIGPTGPPMEASCCSQAIANTTNNC